MKDLIREAVSHLKEGKVILHRPDTIWGLSCDATNKDAIHKIDAIKARAEGKSYIVLVKDIAMMERFVKEIPEVAYDLLDSSVNPMTIIYPEGIGLAAGAIASDGSVAIRVVDDKLTRDIIHGLNRPIISTSANYSGDSSTSILSQINKEIKENVDFIVTREENKNIQKPSTIIKLALNGEFKIIRS